MILKINKLLYLNLLWIFFFIPLLKGQENPYLYDLLKDAQEGNTKKAYIKLGKYYDSLAFDEKALEHYSNVPLADFKDPEIKWNYLFTKALFYRKRKSYRQSNRLAKKLVAEAYSKEVYQVNCNILIADNYLKVYNLDSSAAYYNKVYSFVKESPVYKSLSPIFINNLEYLCYKKYPISREDRDSCNYLTQSMKDEFLESNTTTYSRSINMVFDLITDREFEAANTQLTKIIEFVENNNETQHMGEIMNFMAINDLIRGDLGGAKIRVNQGIDFSKYSDRYWDLINSYKIAMRIAELEGDNETYQNMLFLHEQVKNKEQRQQEEEVKLEENYKSILTAQERRMLDLLNQNTIIEAQKRQLELKNEREEQARKLADAKLAEAQQQAELDKALRVTQRLENERTLQLLEQQKIEAAKAEAEKQLALSNAAEAQRKAELKISEQNLQQAQQEAEQRNFQIIIGIVIASFVFIGILSFLVFARKRNKQLQSKNSQIEEQKNEIIKTSEELEVSKRKIDQSINAAKHIQRSMLPEHSLFESFFPEHSLLYRPKDIVSGDFYWAEKYDDELHFAIVDCTGHGIPGALVSMIARAILNKVFAVNPHTQLDEALNKSHEEIYTQLRQADGKNKDGMDMALCSTKREEDNSLTVRFCGARRPFIYLKEGEDEVRIIKGTRRGIGGRQNEKNKFEEHIINLQEGDRFFLYSDGLPDQFSPSGKKLYEKGVINKINEGTSSDLYTQSKGIETLFETHKGSANQVDDILFLAIEV